MKTFLEQEDLEKMEQSVRNPRDRMMIRLLTRTGCRISELLGLKVSDIDLKSNVIRIEHLKHRIDLKCPKCGGRLGKGSVFCGKCGDKVSSVVSKAVEKRRMRSLPIDKETTALLAEYIKEGGPLYRQPGTKLFPICRMRAWQIIHKAARAAGIRGILNAQTGKIKGVSPHRFRDAFAVRVLQKDDSGTSLKRLQEHLGHAKYDTTAGYLKLSNESQREWYEDLWDDD